MVKPSCGKTILPLVKLLVKVLVKPFYHGFYHWFYQKFYQWFYQFFGKMNHCSRSWFFWNLILGALNRHTLNTLNPFLQGTSRITSHIFMVKWFYHGFYQMFYQFFKNLTKEKSSCRSNGKRAQAVFTSFLDYNTCSFKPWWSQLGLSCHSKNMTILPSPSNDWKSEISQRVDSISSRYLQEWLSVLCS